MTTARLRWLGAVLAATGFLVAGSLPAQTSSEAAVKAKIMAGDAWKQMAAEYQKWLDSQAIYTPDDIDRINAKLAAQVQAMSASEMQDYLNDWLAKLKVLNGKDFQDAQKWLGEYMSALSDGYRAKTLKDLGLTDVANMTADQLANSIEKIRADRLSIQRNQAAFDRMRQQQVQMIQQADAATKKAQQQAAEQLQAAAAVTVRSPYRPSELYNPAPFNFQQPFYVNANGRVGYFLPF